MNTNDEIILLNTIRALLRALEKAGKMLKTVNDGDCSCQEIGKQEK